jgi:hypothetical protein
MDAGASAQNEPVVQTPHCECASPALPQAAGVRLSPLFPLSGARFMTRRLDARGNMRAEVSLSCLLLAFEFGSRREPEFLASTVRSARMVPELIGLFADHLFILVHVMFSRVALLSLRRVCARVLATLPLIHLSS